MKSPKEEKLIWKVLLKSVLTSKVVWGIVGVLFLIGFFLGQAISYGTRTKQEESGETKFFYVTSEDGLNLRLNHEQTAKSLAIMPYGTRLVIVDIENDWALVNFSEKYGWAKTDFLATEKPKELSIREVDFSKLIYIRQGIESILPVEYRDYNKDGREEALVTILKEGNTEAKEYYLYGYQDGTTLKKYLDLRPQVTPQAFVEGYMGHDNLIFKDDKFVLSYPLYKIEDPNCCPTGGNKEISIFFEKGNYHIK